jgi:protein TonB
MNRAVIVTFPSFAASRAATRLRLAVAGSAFAHLLGASALAPHTPAGSAVGGWRSAPITVRLDLQVLPAPPAAEMTHHSGPPEAERLRHPPENVAARRPAQRRVSPAPQADQSESIAVPRVADPTVYAARDLDSFPRPLLPMDTGRLLERAGGAPGSGVRLELLIDEHGMVNEVRFAGPGIAGELERELRATLAAMAFVPARKDGRAVKSRIVVSVNFGQEARRGP